MENLGYAKGDACNRGDCKGVIDEHEKEGGCSCHLSAPCSYCEQDSGYCPVCEWDGEEERQELVLTSLKNNKQEPYTFKRKTFQDLDKTKIDYIVTGSGHSSMTKKGVFPIGTPLSDLLKEIRGSFGGKFKFLGKDSFEYVAYTD